MRLVLEDRSRGYEMVEYCGYYYWGDGTDENSTFVCSPDTVLRFMGTLDEPETAEVPERVRSYVLSHFDGFLAETGAKPHPDADYWGTDRYLDLFPWMKRTA